MNSYFKNNVFSISFGTGLSKLIGFTREAFIAAAFGVGITYDAFNYAYIIPGFFLIIIGGINGPFHNAVVAVLTPINNRDSGVVLTQASIKLTLILILLGLFVYFNASFFVNLIGPNLSNEAKSIATFQLKILTPCIPLSGFIGLSFGALNSRNKFLISSVSPAIISVTIIIFILLSWISNKTNATFLPSSALLASATLVGTFIQFFIQIWAINKIGLLKINSNLNSFIKEEKRIFNLILPACISSGLGQINVYVDMFFASSFQGAASGLAYGNFLIQAPLGIISNSLILPLLTKFSKLKADKKYVNLGKNLTIGIEYCFLTTIFLTAFFITFNNQIVQLAFQRGAFDFKAVYEVRKILIAYSIGIPFYLYRDLLVRTYYSIEKTKLPFKLSLFGILLNIFFDWFLIRALAPYNLEIEGIILSSAAVNFIICFILSINLKNHNLRLPFSLLIVKILLISLSAVITGYTCYSIFQTVPQLNSFIEKLFVLILEALTFFIIYFLITKFLKVNKFKIYQKKI